MQVLVKTEVLIKQITLDPKTEPMNPNEEIQQQKMEEKQTTKAYLIPSKLSSELLIVKIGARAYALATRRLPSNTIILAQISSSI